MAHGGRNGRGPKLVTKFPRSPYYHFDFVVGGTRITGSTGQTQEREAIRLAREARQRLIARHGGRSPRRRGRVHVMTFLAAVERYDKEVGLAWSDEARMDWLTDEIGDGTLLSEIDDELVARLVAKRKATYRWGNPKLGRVTSAEVNRSVPDLLRKLMLRARDAWKLHLPDMPHWRQHRQGEKPRQREMTIQEELALEHAGREDIRPLWHFALLSGLRKRNALLRWSQVDWSVGVIRVTVKGGAQREVPITEEIAEILRRERGHHPEFVFTFIAQKTWTEPRSGRRYVRGQRYPVTPNGFASFWRALCAAAAVRDLHIHDLRKTFGARMTRVAGIAAASKGLHHSTIALTSKTYSYITTDDVGAGMRKTAVRVRLWRRKARRAEADRTTG